MIVLAILMLLAIVVLPQLWVRHTISKHGAERPDLPGTGGELARHLLDRFDLGNVPVEITEKGDHYDPDAKVVRLLRQHHEGRSLSAVAIAAHGGLPRVVQSLGPVPRAALHHPWPRDVGRRGHAGEVAEAPGYHALG